MILSELSSTYTVRKLTERDVDAIYALSLGNPLFYRYCPPDVTRESILEDMRALPPHKTYEDKYYVGFWQQNQLLAVLDLILQYPDEKTAFIGLFMVDQSVQGRGVGTGMISELCDALHRLGYETVRLGYAKGNQQSLSFWLKNQFIPTGEERQNPGYTVVMLQRSLG